MNAPAQAAELLAPLREDAGHAAILLDVDGTLAPIVGHADDARISEPMRAVLTAVARRYEVVACVSGRRACEARRIVSIGSLTYIGNHGAELLAPSAVEPHVDPELRDWIRRVQDFSREAHTGELQALDVRLEDKESIVGFHWRGAPDEDEARDAVEGLAADAEAAGFQTHWGRKVLEVRAPLSIDKGVGVRNLLGETDVAHAMYAGDDVTDVDAFRALGELVDEGELQTAVRIGVRSDEGPEEITREADAVVEGTEGVQRLLASLVDD
ncbi:MAG: trehalose-phosphatase [Actinomycetota bacterium]|nr:trehalose-phosphatase [Actinomycetota bacterium]